MSRGQRIWGDFWKTNYGRFSPCRRKITLICGRISAILAIANWIGMFSESKGPRYCPIRADGNSVKKKNFESNIRFPIVHLSVRNDPLQSTFVNCWSVSQWTIEEIKNDWLAVYSPRWQQLSELAIPTVCWLRWNDEPISFDSIWNSVFRLRFTWLSQVNLILKGKFGVLTSCWFSSIQNDPRAILPGVLS